MSAKKKRKVSTGPNRLMHRAACERARSGAAGPHDSRPRRQRTRAAATRTAIRHDGNT